MQNSALSKINCAKLTLKTSYNAGLTDSAIVTILSKIVFSNQDNQLKMNFSVI